LIIRLKRQIKELSYNIDSTREDIKIIKNRIGKLNIGDIDSGDAKILSEKMASKYEF
jgi:hypothetical protein